MVLSDKDIERISKKVGLGAPDYEYERTLLREQLKKVVEWLREHNSEGASGRYLGLEPDDWQSILEEVE